VHELSRTSRTWQPYRERAFDVPPADSPEGQALHAVRQNNVRFARPRPFAAGRIERLDTGTSITPTVVRMLIRRG
jgi:hypothetical protein